MKLKYLLSVISCLALNGCGTLETTTVQLTEARVDDLIPLQNVSGYDLLYYIGSDEEFHYFDQLSRDEWSRYKVDKSELSFEQEYERGVGWVQVMWPGNLESLQNTAG